MFFQPMRIAPRLKFKYLYINILYPFIKHPAAIVPKSGNPDLEGRQRESPESAYIGEKYVLW